MAARFRLKLFTNYAMLQHEIRKYYMKTLTMPETAICTNGKPSQIPWLHTIMGRKSIRTEGSAAVKPRELNVKKMISGPLETFRKGLARARILFNGDFSKYVCWLIENDYARDQRTITMVADATAEYEAFRRKNPPMPLAPQPPAPAPPSNGPGLGAI